MKLKHYMLLLLLPVAEIASAQAHWVWISGDKSANVNGIYGTQGIAAPGNKPGSRIGAASWTDTQGNLWLFGGRGNGEGFLPGPLNDLWKYNPSTRQWAWMGGDKNPNARGNYGDKGVSSAGNQPGARQNAVCWTDNKGNFWLFGGAGGALQLTNAGLLNDLWMYSPSTSQWTWVSGTNKVNEKGKYGKRNEASDNNYPGGRSMATGFNDHDGNLWLFGGSGYSSKSQSSDLNDVWKYSTVSGKWSWMNGDKSQHSKAHIGQKGAFSDANTPGGREGSTGWTDKQGNFWLFGGGSGLNAFSDLWKYDRIANQWAIINGNNKNNRQPEYTTKGAADPNGNPGGRTLASGWTDSQGNLWLFGGSGYGGLLGANSLNSLWKYSVNSNSWTFVNGETSILPTSVYGSPNVLEPEIQPGGTANACNWTDNQGNFWVFGGQSPGGYGNQSWKLTLDCELPIAGTLKPATASVCEGGSTVLTASGGTDYEWRLNGIIILQNSDSTLAATEPGIYSVLVKNGECIAPALLFSIVTMGTSVSGTVSPSLAAICKGSSQLLTATGGTYYEWSLNGITIAGQTASTLSVTDSGTYTVIIKNGTCSSPAIDSSIIRIISAPTGTISPSRASICHVPSQVLTATGGISYQWMKDGNTLEGETSSTLTATAPGTYTVIINNGPCTAPASNNSVIVNSADTGLRYDDVIVSANVPRLLTSRADGTSYEWTPATGLDNTASPTPTVTTDLDREYYVRIGIAGDCPVVDTVLVKVYSPTTIKKIFIPTAFTPNGNNVNDLLRPLGNIGTIEYFKVYNRWGTMVFQTNEISNGWDGRYKGVEQPAETYTWILLGTTSAGEQIKQSGKTLLIR
ncbi:MAG: kelch repeat-containing protein [Flavitalea sp.]